MQVRLDMLVGDYVRNADRASKATMGIATAAAKPTSALQRVKDASADVGRTIVTAAGLGAAAMATWGVGAFAAGAAFNTLQQAAGSALVTVLGSAEAASDQMEELVSWSRTSPFPRQLWIEAQQMLLGFGMEAERVVPTLAAIQDGVVAVGGSAQSIREVVQILAQVQSTGTITAETLNQLALRGVDAATLIGDSMGRTAAQIREDVSSNALDAQTFLVTLTDSLQDRFEGAAEGLRTTWVGAYDRIKGATRDIGSILAEPFIDPAGGGAAVVWANDVADMLRALEAAMRPAMEVLRDRAEPAVQAVSDAMQRLAAAIRDVDMVALIDRVSDAAPAFAALGAAAAAAGSASVLAALNLGGLAAAINPVSAGLLTLAAVSPELRTALMDLAAAFAPLIPPLTDLAIELAEVATTAAGPVAAVLSALVPLITGLAVAITPVIQVVGALATGIAAIPGPVLAAVASLGALLLLIHQLRAFTGALAIAGALVSGLDAVTGAAGRTTTALAGAKLGFIGLAAGAVLVGLDMLMSKLSDTAKELERVRSVNVGGLVDDLERLGRTGQVIGDLKDLFGEGSDGVDQFRDSLNVATASWWSWSDSINRSINEMSAADDRFEKLDSAMAQLVSTGHDADDVFQSLIDTYDLTDDQVQQLIDLLPQFNREAERQGAAAEEAADGVDVLTEAEAELEEQTDATIRSLKDLADELRAQTDPVFASVRAMQDLEEKQRAYNDALEEYGEGSTEANEAAMAWLESQVKAVDAAGDLADVTGGTLPHELRLMAEEMGISSDAVDWLESQLDDLGDTADSTRDAIQSANGDITTSTGRMQVENALAYEGMDRDQARVVTALIGRVEELIAAGWSYEDAIKQVSAESNIQTALIDQGFKDAAAAGREFSDDYPATITLTGDDEVTRQLNSVQSLINSIDKDVKIGIRYQVSGDPRSFMPQGGVAVPYSRGGRVGGPMGAGDVVPAMLTPGEHVWTPDEVQAAGGHAGVEAMRAATLAGATSHARSVTAAPSASPAAASPTHFTASAVIDLGEGIQRRVDIAFDQHDSELSRAISAGIGAHR